MSRLVLDANVAIDWLIASDEGEAYSRPLADLAAAYQIELIVPIHFDVEVTRVLRKHHKRKPEQFSQAWLKAGLQALDSANLKIVAQGISFELLGDLATAYNLDVPDVPYFHLARMLEIPIASRDRGIIAACKAWGVMHWLPQ